MLLRILYPLLLLSFYSPVAQQLPPEWNFQGKYLIAVSDADMLPSAYEDGRLGPLYGEDQLSVIRFDEGGNPYPLHTVAASNSVAGPPSVVAATSDGKYVFVIETFGARPGLSEAETFSDLAVGQRLSVFDLSNPARIIRSQVLGVPARPLSLSMSHDDQMLAISFHPAGGGAEHPIGLYPFENGRIAEPVYPNLPSWDKQHEMTDVVWHPKFRALAAVNNSEDQIHFYREHRGQLAAWGNTVKVNKYPFIGRFTSDGKHYLTNCMAWGNDVANTWTEAPRTTLVNIALEHHEINGEPVHALTSQIMVGASAEGFAVSPDGRYVASVNMERSWLPYDDPRQTWFSSLSLISRNPVTGALSQLSTTPYYAVLPEMAVFDASGQYLAVVCSDRYDHAEAGGAIDFFKLVHDPLNPKREFFVQTRKSIPLRHGAHDIILVE